MSKLCVFAGTTEGRNLVDFIAKCGACVTACVATEYGETLIKQSENISVSAKRMDQEEMARFFADKKFDLIIDATHPYAYEVTENIIKASETCGVECIRLERENIACSRETIVVDSIEDAVEYLDKTQGNILLTTGSKLIKEFSTLKDFASRVYARVLPMDASLKACEEAGLSPAHIIAMQGPFSVNMNCAVLKAVKAEYLVTKQSGKTGGFKEKLDAAEMLGVKPIVIGRHENQGIKCCSFNKTIDLLCERFGFVKKTNVSVIGIGPGSLKQLTLEARNAIDEADCLIGAKRMIEAVNKSGVQCFEEIAPQRIANAIKENGQFSNFAVLMSGDSGFFSGTKKLLPLIEEYAPRVISGISSLSYLAAKCGISYETAYTLSAHGRKSDIVSAVRNNALVFALTDAENSPSKLCECLVNAGLENVKVTVGEDLSYETERIMIASAHEIASACFSKLCAVFFENANYENKCGYQIGIDDEAFIRSDTHRIPMTKSEVRAVCMSKLCIARGSVCFDIGAGTGSVTVEMALAANAGKVYAIEKNKNALGLLKENIDMFSLDNVELVEGIAPECLQGLPVPTHAFIGGSSGNMRAIIKSLLDMNPSITIVATAIALETVAQLTSCMSEFEFKHTETVLLSVARASKIGGYNMMSAQNPIHIFKFIGGIKE